MDELIKSLPWNKRIEIIRTIKGWGQREAAEKCFTGQKNFWAWEKGLVYPRKNSRRAISQAFKVKEKDIFGDEQ